MAKKKISPINEEFDFKLLVTIARKNTMWFALFLMTSVVSAMLILRYTAPVYEATSVIQLSEQDNARGILNNAQFNRFNETNNKLASSIELMRSRVIVERALLRLPLQVSYYSKGEILTNELYTQSPFRVETRIKDSSIIGQPIFIDFLTKNSFKLFLKSTAIESLQSKTFKDNEWIITPAADFKISINDYATIQALQQELSKDAFYFKLNNLTGLAAQIIKELNITPLNTEARTIQIKLKDKNQAKATDIVNGIAVSYTHLTLPTKA